MAFSLPTRAPETIQDSAPAAALAGIAADAPAAQTAALDPLRPMVLSATQIETYNTCARKWWFKQVRKLPEPQRGNLTFGTVLHAVLERFLKADEFGNGADGQPVELFPAGWEYATDREGRRDGAPLPLAEQDQVRRLVAEAISAGVLERLPGRRVEKQFSIPMFERRTAQDQENEEGIGAGEGNPSVRLMGFIDLSHAYRHEDGTVEASVQDHKTSKSVKYLKSANALTKNTQLLIYAKSLLEELKAEGIPAPEKISLRHNGYAKDTHREVVRKTEAFVSPAEVEEHWETCKQTAKRMIGTRNAKNWFDIPDPARPQEACNAYGVCPYFDICSGKESPEHYEKRLTLTLRGAPIPAGTASAPTSSQKEIVMAKSFSELQAEARAKAALQTAPAASTAPAAEAPARVVPPVPVAAPVSAPVPAPAAHAPAQVPGLKFSVPGKAPVAAAPAPAPVAAAPAPAPTLAEEAEALTFEPVEAAAPASVPAAAASVALVAPVRLSEDAKQAGLVLPPWADETVAVNDGLGFTSAGAVCQVCEEKFRQQGNLPQGAYLRDYLNFTVSGEKTVQWATKPEVEAEGVPHMEGVSPLCSDWKKPTVEAQEKVEIKKRGRPKGSVNKAKEVEAATEETAAAPVAQIEVVQTAAAMANTISKA